MSDTFYKAFEDRYRGERAIIGARLGAYLPFLTPLAAAGQPARALDLGCGRGEWLELTGAHGFDATGVDLDDAMLAACRERGLAVQTGDALAALRALPDASLALVSAFHLVEHIAFDAVRELIAQSLRVLRPGGLLIMETPNPENLVVGASSFYRDPSHVRPLPPELLAFAVEHGGYARHTVMRLQEDAALHGEITLGVQHVLDGVSPDYAVVAQKAGPAQVTAPLDAPFGASYGISLGQISHRYDIQSAEQRGALDTARSLAEQSLSQLDAVRASVAELAAHASRGHASLSARMDQHEQRLQHSEARLGQADARLDQGDARAAGHEARLANYEARLLEAEARARKLDDVLASRSWRITEPMRQAGTLARAARQGLRVLVYRLRTTLAPKTRLRRLARAAARAALRSPRAKRAARLLLARMPGLQARLREMMYQAPVAPGAAPPPTQQPHDLSPRAARLYAALKAQQSTTKDT